MRRFAGVVLTAVIFAGVLPGAHAVPNWLPRPQIDASLSALLPDSGNERDSYDRAQRLFGSDDVLLLVWADVDLFETAHLRALQRLTQRIERMPEVRRVESLANATTIRGEDDELAIGPLLTAIPTRPDTLAAFRAELIGNRLYAGRLVSRDGNAAMLIVHPEPYADGVEIARLADRLLAASRLEAPDVTAYLSGPLAARLTLGTILERDFHRVLFAVMLTTGIVAACGLGTFRGLLLALLANLLALGGTLLCLRVTGHALNLITVMLPPVVYVIGFTYTVHVVAGFERRRAQGLTRAAAVQSVISDVTVPIGISALATLAGFAALGSSSMPSVRHFGAFACFGTVLAWGIALSVVPVGLRFGRHDNHSKCRESIPSTDLCARLASFSFRYRRWLVAGSILLTVAAVVGATRITVDTDYLRSFTADHPLRLDTARMNAVFNGAAPITILFETPTPHGLTEPDNLRAIAELREWLAAQPEIGGVYAVTDFLARALAALQPEQSLGNGVPDTRELAREILLLFENDDTRRLIDSSHRATVIRAVTSSTSTRELLGLYQRISSRLETLPPQLQAHVTGTPILLARTFDVIARDQVRSVVWAAALVLLLLMAVGRSPRIGIAALLPNLLPIALFFGLLGWASIALSLCTSLLAPLVLAIAVDDSVHFFTHFRRFVTTGTTAIDAVKRTLQIIVRPVTLTSAALICGFLAMSISELRNVVEFGCLAAMMLALAWLLDLTLTPALACATHASRERPVRSTCISIPGALQATADPPRVPQILARRSASMNRIPEIISAAVCTTLVVGAAIALASAVVRIGAAAGESNAPSPASYVQEPLAARTARSPGYPLAVTLLPSRTAT